MMIVFICAFEFGPGPVVWLYISEICTDKTASVATAVNQLFTLLVSIFSPYMLTDWLKAHTWLLYANFSLLVSTTIY